jgi:hypothetical protein
MNRGKYPKPSLEKISRTLGLGLGGVDEVEGGHLELLASREYHQTKERNANQAWRLTP